MLPYCFILRAWTPAPLAEAKRASPRGKDGGGTKFPHREVSFRIEAHELSIQPEGTHGAIEYHLARE